MYKWTLILGISSNLLSLALGHETALRALQANRNVVLYYANVVGVVQNVGSVVADFSYGCVDNDAVMVDFGLISSPDEPNGNCLFDGIRTTDCLYTTYDPNMYDNEVFQWVVAFACVGRFNPDLRGQVCDGWRNFSAIDGHSERSGRSQVWGGPPLRRSFW